MMDSTTTSNKKRPPVLKSTSIRAITVEFKEKHPSRQPKTSGMTMMTSTPASDSAPLNPA